MTDRGGAGERNRRDPWEDTIEDPSEALYTVGVVAELMDVDPQVVRGYDQRGLVAPSRSGSGQRRYSRDDIRRLSRAMRLADEGIPSSGIGRILDLEDELDRRDRLTSLGDDEERDDSGS